MCPDRLRHQCVEGRWWESKNREIPHCRQVVHPDRMLKGGGDGCVTVSLVSKSFSPGQKLGGCLMCLNFDWLVTGITKVKQKENELSPQGKQEAV